MGTKKEETAVVASTTNVPSFMKFNEDSSRGNENVSKEDLVIPRLGQIQAISPELDETDPAYIPGAKVGQFFNTVTREIYGTEVMIVPVVFEKQYNVWKDRKKGGGFGGSFKTEDDAYVAIEEMEDPDDWDVLDTPTHVCLIIHNGKVAEIAVPMSKSKAKVSRQWNSMIRMLGGDRFCRVYQFIDVGDKNNAGEKYRNIRIENLGFIQEEAIFKKAEKLYEDISSGELKYSVDQGMDEEKQEGDAPPEPKGKKTEKNRPF